jgi:uncharacterized RDD family membrane protein YckC
MNESISIMWQCRGMRADERPAGLVTPEAVALELDIAGIGSRVVGALIDGLIQGAVLVAGVIAASMIPFAGEGFGLVVLGVVFFTFMIYGYQGLFEGLWEGQTPGKRVAHTRVVSDNGQPVRWRQVLIRSIFRLLDSSPIGVVVIILTRRSQRLGDLAAGTIVVRDQKAPEPAVLELSPNPRRDELARTLDASSLTEQEYALIRSFLQRRATLTPAARAEIATRLASPVSLRLGGQGGAVSEEEFLEAVVMAVRAPSQGSETGLTGS